MATFARFFDPDTDGVLFDLPVLNANIEFGLNQSTRWSMTIDLNVYGIETIFRGLTVELYVDGVLILEGQLQEFSPVITGESEIAIKGHSFLDALYDSPSYPLSYYDDKPVLGVLTELLIQNGWLLGEVGTVANPDQTMTKDLKGEKNALTQLKSALDGLEGTYYREGGSVLGTRRLDIGSFQEKSGISLVMPSEFSTYEDDDDYAHVLTDLSYTVDFTDAIHAVRMEGGKVRESGADRVIHLGDAGIANRDLMHDQEFPIVEDMTDSGWVLYNNRDYPYIGGVIHGVPRTNLAGLSQFTIGDNDGANNINRKVLQTFYAFPGRLRSFTFWWNTIAWTAALVTDIISGANAMTWSLWEVDTTTNNTLIDGPFASGVYTNEAIYYSGRVYPNSGPVEIVLEDNVVLEAGKYYGIVHELAVDPTPATYAAFILIHNVVYSPISWMKLQYLDTLPNVGIGSVFTTYARLWPFRVETVPLSRLFSGFTVEKESKYAPQKTGADAAAGEISRAGLALYDYGKAFLTEHRPRKREYSASTVGTKRLPRPGDTVYVKGKAVLEYYDTGRDRILQTVYDEIDADLRVSGYTVTIANDEISVDYKLLDEAGVIESERLLNLYDNTEQKDPPEGAANYSLWGLVLDTLTTSIPATSPDTTMVDGRNAISVSLSILSGSVPSIPQDTQSVYMAGLPYGTSNNGDLDIEMVSEPEFLSSGTVDFKVSLKNRGWEFGDTADLTVKLIWR